MNSFLKPLTFMLLAALAIGCSSTEKQQANNPNTAVSTTPVPVMEMYYTSTQDVAVNEFGPGPTTDFRMYEPITLDLRNSTGVASYLLEMIEADAAGNLLGQIHSTPLFAFDPQDQTTQIVNVRSLFNFDLDPAPTSDPNFIPTSYYKFWIIALGSTGPSAVVANDFSIKGLGRALEQDAGHFPG